MSIEKPNHPDAVCSLHGLPCHELGKVLIERDALRPRLSAIENLCALNPRLADGEVHHTAMLALAAIREGR